MAEQTGLLSLLEKVAALREDVDGPAHLVVVESSIRRGEMPPLHTHPEDEALYVLEGSLTVHTGQEQGRISGGQAIVVPKELPHTHCADSDQVRYLSMTFVRSAGRYEDFLRAVAVPRSESPDWSGDDAAAVIGIARANGIVVLGPPGALPSGD